LGLKLLRKVERYKSPRINQVPVEVIQAGGNVLRSEVFKMINSLCSKEELLQQWKEQIIVPI